MTDAQLCSFERKCREQGFLVWAAPAVTDRGRQAHDTILLTRDYLQSRFVADYGGQDGSFIAVKVQGCVFLALHAKPWVLSADSYDMELVSVIASLDADAAWAALGDYNEEPDACSLQFLLHEGGATTMALSTAGRWVPTRWESNRAIDYLVSNIPQYFMVQNHWEEKYGDHKVVEFSYRSSTPIQQSWCLPTTVKYDKPEDITPAKWKQDLAKAWAERRGDIPRHASTEEQYWWFCSELEAMFRRALRGQAPHIAGKRPKGTAAALQPRAWQHGAHNGGEGRHQERKLRIAAGRLRALMRIPDHHQACRQQLQAKLARAIGFDARVDSVAHVLRKIENQIDDTVKNSQKARVRDWRERMKSNGAFKWIKKGLCRIPNSIYLVGDESTASATIGEALDCLRRHWRRIWDRPPVRWEDVQEAYSFPANCTYTWKCPEAGELAAAAKSQAGRAAGLDGWSGDELAAVPEAAWQCFAELLRIWFSRAREGDRYPFPMDWRCIKQVHIPKASATQQRSQATPISSKDMRPISLECTLWRVTMSCVARQHKFKEWVNGWKPNCAHGALPGLGVHTAVAVLDEAFRSGEAIVSQDFSEAFDRASPELSINALRKAGIAPELAAALEWVWAHQVRWLCFGHYVHPQAQEVCTSLPQGDPLSPLGLLALMCGPLQQVQQDMRVRGHDCTIVTYVDDRNSVVESVEAAASLVGSWRREAPRFGMKENETKLRIVPRGGAAKRQRFKNQLMAQLVCPDSTVVDTQRILGVDVGGAATADIPLATGAARLLEAERRARRMAMISQGRVCMKTFLATSVSAVAQWGWWLREPRKELQKFAKIMRIGLRDASTTWSKYLRKIFLGHRLDGFFAMGFHAWTMLRAAFQAGYVQRWEHRNCVGTWLNRVQRWLLKLSWREVSPWRWRHSDFGEVFWSSSGQGKSQHDHALRESWRQQCFNDFLAQQRRDSSEAVAHAVHYDGERLKAAIAAACEYGLHASAVLGGGVVSDALFAVQCKLPLPQQCSWCKLHVVPGWDHQCWQCQCEAFSATRPSVPEDFMQRRFAWPCMQSKDYDTAVLRHVISVRQELLRARWESRPAGSDDSVDR